MDKYKLITGGLIGIGTLTIGGAFTGAVIASSRDAEKKALEERIRSVRFVEGEKAGLANDTGYFIKNANIVIVKTGNEYHVDFAARQVAIGNMFSKSRPTSFDQYPAEWIEQARLAGIQSAEGILEHKDSLLQVKFPENAPIAKKEIEDASGFLENHGGQQSTINVDLTTPAP